MRPVRPARIALLAALCLISGCGAVAPVNSSGVRTVSVNPPAGTSMPSPAVSSSPTDATTAPTGLSTTPPMQAVTERPPSTPPSASTSAASRGVAPPGAVVALLSALPVKGRAPKTGYSRADFGDAWTDDVSVDGGHNGCDTRNDVLRRDLLAATIKAGTNGCVAATGTLDDPYTGKVIAFIRGAKTSVRVQIDHVVALSDAWQTGAQALSEPTRQNLANDPLELLAVDGPTNESKGDGDAATWLPPNKAFRCAYVARQIAVKTRYQLWVTAAERDALASVLATCPGQSLPADSNTDTPAIVRN